MAQIVVDRGAQLGGPLRGRQVYRAAGGVGGADLADDEQVLPVGRKRLADPAVDLAAGVKGRGVDVVDAEFDGAAQHRCRVGRGWRLIELHRAVADAGNRHRSDPAEATGVWFVCHGAPLKKTRFRLERCGGASACSCVAETEEPPL